MADRCGGDTRILVHDLDAPPSKRELGMMLSTWAALRARRAGASAPADEAPPAPRGVAKAHWAALLAGEHALYLSAFEMPTHAPEIATAFDAIAGAVCMLRHVPGAHENVGPIVMDADKGASSGWCVGYTALERGMSSYPLLPGTETARGCAAKRFEAAT